jgi:DNA-directed RNA polymerase subunit L
VKEPLKWNSEKYKFILHVVNDMDEVKDVFAGDFKVFEKNGVDDQLKPVPSSQFFPPHPVTGKTALLATLKPMMPGGSPEEILLEAVATVGIGRENARFIPTSQCSYGYTKDVNPETLKKVFDDWLIQSKMELNPSALETQPEKKAILEREFKSLEINRCYLKNEKGEPYSFDFTVESVDVLDPAYIVLRGCEAGIELCEKFRSDSLPESVVVQRIEGLLHGFDFFFQGQDHTLGHLIQAWIDENLMDDGDITFVGYDIPHPLRDEMVIRIGVSETVDNDEATARNALQKAMTACQTMFQRWRNE